MTPSAHYEILKPMKRASFLNRAVKRIEISHEESAHGLEQEKVNQQTSNAACIARWKGNI
jgi:hypothetical protein